MYVQQTEYQGIGYLPGYNYTGVVDSDHKKYPIELFMVVKIVDFDAWKAVNQNEHIFGQFCGQESTI